jgi:hypothetical protein
MRVARCILVILCSLIASFNLNSQETTVTLQQDAQAISLLRFSLAAMGKSVPSDSTAHGTVITVEGSRTENGDVVILTRGTDQSTEQIQTAHGSTVVHSGLLASQTTDSVLAPLSLELASSSRSLAFPLPMLAAILNNADSRYIYVGLESLDGANVHHVQFWNSFASQPKYQFLAQFTLTDIWIDAISGLPQKTSQIQKAGRGSEPKFQIDIYFSNYQNVGGLLYPFSIQKSLNGSPWINISISNVTFNTGLTDANFVLQ